MRFDCGAERCGFFHFRTEQLGADKGRRQAEQGRGDQMTRNRRKGRMKNQGVEPEHG